jgi:hypothetical protein
MPTIGSLTTFTPATTAQSSQVNSNFSTIRTTVNAYCAFIDTACTITGAWTFSTAPTISGAMSFGSTVAVASGLTVAAGGVTVTGNSTITGTLSGLTGLTVASGGLTVTAGASTFGAAVTITGTCTATTFSGSGASLTSLPAAQLTGTIDQARLPGTITTLTVTNLTATNPITGSVTTATTATQLSNVATLKVDPSESTFLNTGGAASYVTTSAPAGGGTTRYINVTVDGVACRIACVTVA